MELEMFDMEADGDDEGEGEEASQRLCLRQKNAVVVAHMLAYILFAEHIRKTNAH